MKYLMSPGARRVSLTALGAFLALVLAGCNDGVKVSAPLATLTPIANCIVDGQNDVEIGGTHAPAGCKSVVMEPSASNPAAFGDIDVEAGGTLLITGTNITEPASPATSDTTAVYEEREICVGTGGTVKYEKGTSNGPVTSKHKILMKFIGNRDSKPTGSDPCAKEGFQKGIDVLAGGTLLMYGAKGVPQYDSNGNNIGGTSWTTLAAPAGSHVPGARAPVPSTNNRTLYLTADVTKAGKGQDPWEHGDWIVVATTDYTPFHSEFVQIDTVKSGGNVKGAGSTITLMQPLEYYHFGSLPPSPATVDNGKCADPFAKSAHPVNPNGQPQFLCDGPDRNYGVDERAEVGLISRDIELTSVTEPVTKVPPPATSSVHWGGEIKIHTKFDRVVIQGVRLSKFGKDQLGSYPIHFHEVGTIAQAPNPDTQSAVINADSVDHSYNKCVTIHETSDLAISNMVCARIVGHIYYEELGDYNAENVADDSGIVFDHDLGLGSMSNSFDIYKVEGAAPPNPSTISRAEMIRRYWWSGDNMTNDSSSPDYINYDGFNVPDTDNPKQWVHGSCVRYDPNLQGAIEGYISPLSTDKSGATTYTPCSKVVNPEDPTVRYPVYIEPASGFWIQNPKTVLTNDAIAGCQGVGRGFWWVTPTQPILLKGNGSEEPKFFPLGKFKDNRASACYAGFYGEGEYGVHSDQLFPHKGGVQQSPAIVATLDGMTATRDRFRGVWLRPVWFVIKDGHFASSRENVSLVTSGGIDGNAPGVWDLLEDSVIVGFSQNNVGRWGPCPRGSVLGKVIGGEKGCIDQSAPPNGSTPHSGAQVGLGYEPPSWNDFGYMLYDGPVRVFHDRFVDFNHNAGWTDTMPCSGTGAGAFYKELDDADCTFLRLHYELPNSSPTGEGPPAPYEGDAALGWFQSNQSAYPTGTASRELMWLNTNLRHQIYTQHVSVNTNFNDGDKNTAIIDEDGTLSGLGVQKASSAGTNPVHAISLNNLPFNATSNSVDECLSRGAQNELYEGRDTSLMSPASMGTLEFSSLYPYLKDKAPPTSPSDFPGDTNSHWQDMTFTRTDLVAEAPPPSTAMFHPDMVMKTGRNGLGIWEPKVSNGYGYTVRVSPTTAPSVPPVQNSHMAGLWNWIEVGLADVVDPNISTAHPFYIRLGINYTDANGNHPPNASYFTIERGYKSYTGGNMWEAGNTELNRFWTKLDCTNLDANHTANLPTKYGGKGYCPSAAPGAATSSLADVGDIHKLTSNGKPVIKAYYYDATTGYLWLNIVQDEPNPVGPSPLGSCDSSEDGGTADPSCPHWQDPERESYYACPKNGCIIYTIAVKSDSNYTYTPGPSVGSAATANVEAMAPPPATAQNHLKVVYGTNPGTIVAPVAASDRQGVIYHTASQNTAPDCPVTQHDSGG